MTTEPEFRCLHCNATASAREAADGWCDACGKRLPESYAAKVKNVAAPKKQPEPATRTRLVGCGLPALLAMVGAVAVVGVLLAS
jgi:hypothetical protein